MSQPDEGGPEPSIYVKHTSSVLPGSTNAGVMPRLVLGTQALTRMAPAIAEALEKQILFVSSDGNAVAAAPIAAPEVAPLTFDFVVRPAAPLLEDTWYDVTYSPSTIEIAIGVDGAVATFTPVIGSSPTYYLGEGILTRFFTGSAPQLREVTLITGFDGGTSNTLLISMSEPVSLDGLLSDGFVASAATPMNGTFIGCVVAGRDCREPSPIPEAAKTEIGGFQYQLDAEVPIQFELALALSLRGTPRTIQEGLDARAVRGATTVSEGFLRYAMDVSTWRQRVPAMLSWLNAE